MQKMKALRDKFVSIVSKVKTHWLIPGFIASLIAGVLLYIVTIHCCTIVRFLIGSCTINNGLLIVICIFAIMGIVVTFRWIFKKFTPKKYNRLEYTRDTFERMIWTWRWDADNNIQLNNPQCANCLFELDSYPIQFDAVSFCCSRCGESYLMKTNMLEDYKERIKKKIRHKVCVSENKNHN